jgi:hypothetical protein
MFKILRQILTGKDNETHEVIRWLTVLSVILGHALLIYDVVYRGKPFNLQEYGVGVGALFVAAGVALRLKENDEPVVK